jgi:hypothetical protein
MGGDVEDEFDGTELVGTAAINAGHGAGIAVMAAWVKPACWGESLGLSGETAVTFGLMRFRLER